MPSLLSWCGRRPRRLPVAPGDAAGGGRTRPQHDVEQRRLAGAVRADEPVHRAGFDRERHVVERDQPAEADADPATASPGVCPAGGLTACVLPVVRRRQCPGDRGDPHLGRSAHLAPWAQRPRSGRWIWAVRPRVWTALCALLHSADAAQRPWRCGHARRRGCPGRRLRPAADGRCGCSGPRSLDELDGMTDRITVRVLQREPVYAERDTARSCGPPPGPTWSAGSR